MIELIPRTSYKVVPWKNGRGITHEIAAEEGAEPGWRLSIATIDRDGPFSDFSSYDRTIMTLEGGDIELFFHDDESITSLKPEEPFVFSGDREVSSRLLGGSVRDFNVMTKRDRFSHTVEIVSGQRDILVSAGEWYFVLILVGQLSVPLNARAGETVRISKNQNAQLQGNGDLRYALVRILEKSSQ